jgi:hypothetical protein
MAQSGFHTEVGEVGTPVGIVETPSLSYSEPTNGPIVEMRGRR